MRIAREANERKNEILDDGFTELTEEERLPRIQAFVFHLERLLGAGQGRFDFILQMLGNGGQNE